MAIASFVAVEAISPDLLADLERRVLGALAHVRPFLRVDGGDVELVRIDLESRVVEVCFLGACKTCSLSPMTLRAGIERAILHDAPEIKRVEAVAKVTLDLEKSG